MAFASGVLWTKRKSILRRKIWNTGKMRVEKGNAETRSRNMRTNRRGKQGKCERKDKERMEKADWGEENRRTKF